MEGRDDGDDDGCKEEMFYNEGGEMLEQVAQRCCGCPIIGSVQGQPGCGFEHCDLVKKCLCPWQED